jgi:hypothetical protein
MSIMRHQNICSLAQWIYVHRKKFTNFGGNNGVRFYAFMSQKTQTKSRKENNDAAYLPINDANGWFYLPAST